MVKSIFYFKLRTTFNVASEFDNWGILEIYYTAPIRHLRNTACAVVSQIGYTYMDVNKNSVNYTNVGHIPWSYF